MWPLCSPNKTGVYIFKIISEDMDSHFNLPKKRWPTDSRKIDARKPTSLIEVWFGFRKPHFLGQAKTKSEPEDQELAVFVHWENKGGEPIFHGWQWFKLVGDLERFLWGVLELNGIGSFACFLFVCVFFGLLYLLAQNYGYMALYDTVWYCW